MSAEALLRPRWEPLDIIIAALIDLDHSMVHSLLMEVSVSDAKAQLTDLVRRAEAGEEVVLTRHGQAAVKLVPIKAKLTAAEKRAVIDEIMEASHGKALPGPSAARSQDFLYGDDGMPG